MQPLVKTLADLQYLFLLFLITCPVHVLFDPLAQLSSNFHLRAHECASPFCQRLAVIGIRISTETTHIQTQQGVTRTKHRKQSKLKRQMASIRKANKKEDGNNGEARFAAMQLINDPQSFAEHLFNRLQGGSALKFDTKMLLIQVRYQDP
jgi:hypothetical protein